MDKSILEIACGTGRFSFLFAEKFPNSQIVGVDITPCQIEYAQKINTYKNLRFQIANCEYLPFPDNSFDVVFGSGILHHLPDIRKTVSEISRVLKSGKGVYLGFEPNCYNFYNWFRLYFWPANKTVNERPIFFKEIRKIFNNYGFEKIKFQFFSQDFHL